MLIRGGEKQPVTDRCVLFYSLCVPVDQHSVGCNCKNVLIGCPATPFFKGTSCYRNDPCLAAVNDGGAPASLAAWFSAAQERDEIAGMAGRKRGGWRRESESPRMQSEVR
ncbi:hypothetical protein Pla8534_16150 [Lignipirellula cremea]|uniref:Uncharacterized protein n=1 Tax=Lignipirellula cremea TaxID=2528010 RepID=A0A518DPR1_9BACT|nr:hypothetical protein Pla8534_16150 [Lignipirellula cremea]